MLRISVIRYAWDIDAEGDLEGLMEHTEHQHEHEHHTTAPVGITGHLDMQPQPPARQNTELEHGMGMLGTMDHAGHGGAHADHTGHEQMFRRRFWQCLVLTIPVLLFSPMIQTWFGFRMPDFPGRQLVGPAFAIVIFLYGGLPF